MWSVPSSIVIALPSTVIGDRNTKYSFAFYPDKTGRIYVGTHFGKDWNSMEYRLKNPMAQKQLAATMSAEESVDGNLLLWVKYQETYRVDLSAEISRRLNARYPDISVLLSAGYLTQTQSIAAMNTTLSNLSAKINLGLYGLQSGMPIEVVYSAINLDELAEAERAYILKGLGYTLELKPIPTDAKSQALADNQTEQQISEAKEQPKPVAKPALSPSTAIRKDTNETAHKPVSKDLVELTALDEDLLTSDVSVDALKKRFKFIKDACEYFNLGKVSSWKAVSAKLQLKQESLQRVANLNAVIK